MPIQPPHYVSSLAFRISGLFRISRFGFSPTCRGVLCKTNPIPATGDPDFTKRTQFTPTPAWPTIQICETNPIPHQFSTVYLSREGLVRGSEPNFVPVHDQNTRNEPNSSFVIPAEAGIHEPRRRETTNYQPKMRNEPNLPSHHPPTLPNAQNEPNLPHPHHPPTQKYETNPILPGQPPKKSKRTQFHKANCQKPTAKKHKTNPIRARPAVNPYGIST